MYLGDFTTANTVYVGFDTYDSNDPSASVTMTGFSLADIKIYKNGSTTERSSTAGITLLDTDGTDFDGLTGIHGFSIDLSDNTDSGFYAAGGEYRVVVASVTVDGATVNFTAANFSIERTGCALALLKGTNSLSDIEGKIDTLTANVAAVQADTAPIRSGTAQAGAASTITLDAGASATNSLYNGQWISIMSGTGAGQTRLITGYVGSTKVVTVANAWITNPDSSSVFRINRAAWIAGVNALAANSVSADAIASNAITSAKIASGAITSTQIAANAIGASQIASDAITAAKIAADAIGASELAADAATEIATAVWAAAVRTLTAGTNLNNLSQADIRTAIGIAAANLDTQIALLATAANLATVAGYVDTEIATLQTTLDGMAGATFDTSTDSLEAIRNRGDAAWITGGGGSAPTVEEIRIEMDDNSTKLSAILGDTNELQSDDIPGLIAALNDFDPTSDTVDVGKINGSAEAASDLAKSAATIVSGAAATGTLSTTQMTTDLSEATDDHYNGRIIIWTSGVLKDQATNITDYVGAGGLLTFTATTEAPSNGDTFVIV